MSQKSSVLQVMHSVQLVLNPDSNDGEAVKTAMSERFAQKIEQLTRLEAQLSRSGRI